MPHQSCETLRLERAGHAALQQFIGTQTPEEGEDARWVGVFVVGEWKILRRPKQGHTY